MRSIAVLPLVNVGGDSAQEFFADGIAEELANALGKVPGLRVTARTSSYAFEGRRDLDVREIGEKLNVGVVLQGSVRRLGERVKVSVQLMDARNAPNSGRRATTTPRRISMRCRIRSRGRS